jgi:hypothetical protein
MATIEELLKSMLTLPTEGKKGDFLGLENNKATWERIANKDSFAELDFESESAKEEWLKEWIEANPYQNIN